jgi:hypothetical protein
MLLSVSCAPRVLEIPAQLAQMTDAASGYYAYVTPLPSTDVDSVILVPASRDRLLGKRIVNTPEPQTVYRHSMIDYTVALDPDVLGDLLTELAMTGTLAGDGDLLPLGYFQKDIGDEGVWLTQWGTSTPTELLHWGRLSSSGLDKAKAALQRMRETGARFGGQAIVDVIVYRQGPVSYVSGTLVAYATAEPDTLGARRLPLHGPFSVPLN